MAAKKRDYRTRTHCSSHRFTAEELTTLRRELLNWYDNNKRDLPWRRRVETEQDADVRAYAVWVSEVMLQQTQVSTVIDYYNRWMKKWPTVHDLAAADLEEVNQLWSGLGYYRRGRSLWHGAQKLVLEKAGRFPQLAKELKNELPGVGRYTAGAIASIAFNEAVAAVDGNVTRVFARLRVIGAEASSQETTRHIWSLAEEAVEVCRPGDFNQALMELGATVCTPRNPFCQKCPLNTICAAFQLANGSKSLKSSSIKRLLSAKDCSHSSDGSETVQEIGSLSGCELCLPSSQVWDESGVTCFPQKAKKKPPRVEHILVVVMQHCSGKGTSLMLQRRPATGLLAGQWEFPSTAVRPEPPMADMKDTVKRLLSDRGVEGSQLAYAGTYTHLFSHVHHHYYVWSVNSTASPSTSVQAPPCCWVEEEDLHQYMLTTATKKILKLARGGEEGRCRKRVASHGEECGDGKRSRTINSFFTASSSSSN